jgi:hypothetical protein
MMAELRDLPIEEYKEVLEEMVDQAQTSLDALLEEHPELGE